jgi:hypothetical protein
MHIATVYSLIFHLQLNFAPEYRNTPLESLLFFGAPPCIPERFPWRTCRNLRRLAKEQNTVLKIGRGAAEGHKFFPGFFCAGGE